MTFKVAMHRLVPRHTLLEEKEQTEVLQKYGVDVGLLPKILTSDPVIRQIASERDVKPETLKGRIVRIDRASETAGTAASFRVIIDG